MMFTNAVHLALEVRNWTIPVAVVFIFFVIVHFGYFILYGLLVQTTWLPDAPVLVFNTAMMSLDFWLATAITLVIAIFPRFATKCLWNTLFSKNVKKID